MEENAKQLVIEGMKACIPDDAPVPFTIKTATWLDTHSAIAEVELFDRKPGTITVSRQPLWHVWWGSLPGGILNWNETEKKWERLPEVRVDDWLMKLFPRIDE